MMIDQITLSVCRTSSLQKYNFYIIFHCVLYYKACSIFQIKLNTEQSGSLHSFTLQVV